MKKADKLAKAGSRMFQDNNATSFETAKQIAKQNSKEVWYNDWMTEEKGRPLFKYLPTPNPKDPIHSLNRQDYCNIFRLRTGHSTLNDHRNRFDIQAPWLCRHCNLSRETVEHHLLECNKLKELRKELLPKYPNIEKCLYGCREQLVNTSKFHMKALRSL